ncbi:MAG TPA: hypothetical protein VLX85_12950 [Stellaceae bacterium]|nr:hypothetical protein [Stellaceae bacterium]
MRAEHLRVAMLLALSPAPAGAAEIAAQDAAQHVGENATVCGTVASAHHVERSRLQPTFLDLDRTYPNQSFTVVIFGSNRAKFGTPERALLHQRICATGEISLYQGRPEMVVHDVAQIVRQAR